MSIHALCQYTQVHPKLNNINLLCLFLSFIDNHTIYNILFRASLTVMRLIYFVPQSCSCHYSMFYWIQLCLYQMYLSIRLLAGSFLASRFELLWTMLWRPSRIRQVVHVCLCFCENKTAESQDMLIFNFKYQRRFFKCLYRFKTP